MSLASPLPDPLALAARGDKAAFLRFYDATCGRVYALELARARARDLGAATALEVAAVRTRRRFVTAWELAAQQPGSRLSPLAWLLSLELP